MWLPMFRHMFQYVCKTVVRACIPVVGFSASSHKLLYLSPFTRLTSLVLLKTFVVLLILLFIHWYVFARKCAQTSAYLMYGNNSAGVGVGGVLICGSFYMCPTVECILCSENVYTAHCMKQ